MAVSFLLISLAFSQGKGADQPTAAELVLNKKANELSRRGLAELKEKRCARAVQTFQEVIVIRRGVRGHHLEDFWNLGRAYEGASQRDEAISAYRKMYRWYSSSGELDINSPRFTEYAMLLFKSGKREQAKQLHYAYLRGKMKNSSDQVWTIFDPDPSGDSRLFNEPNFEAAMQIVRSTHLQGQEAWACVKKASDLARDWYLPHLMLAMRYNFLASEPGYLAKDVDERIAWRSAKCDVARTLAPNDVIKNWIDSIKQDVEADRDFRPLNPDPKTVRDQLQCLKEGKTWMQSHWAEIAEE